MSDPTFETLLAIREDIGRLSAEVRGTNTLLQGHIEDDRALGERLQRMELSGAAQRGSIKVITSFAVAAAALVAFAVTSVLSWLGLKH